MNLSKENVLARIKQALIYLLVVLLLILLDQVSKAHTVRYIGNQTIDLIPNVLALTYVKNTGAVWGIGQGQTWLFALMTPLCIGLLIFLYIKTPRDKKFRLIRIDIAVIIAGAVGNLIDRLFNGYVVDMIYFKLIDFPVFNIADSYITVGVIVLVGFILFWKDFGDVLFGSKK